MIELAMLSPETGALGGLFAVCAVALLLAIWRDPEDPRADVRAMAMERLAQGDALPYDHEREVTHAATPR